MVFALRPVQNVTNVVSLNPLKIVSLSHHDCLHSNGKGLWRIQSGYVRTFTWNDQGDSISLGFWQAGDVLGQAIAQTAPYQAQCLGPVTADYLGETYAFSRAAVLAHVTQSNELLKISHCRQTDQSLLHFLCWLSTRLGQQTAEGYEIDFKLTHQEIADSIGCTRVTATRMIKTLDREGKIHWTASKKLVYAGTIAKFECLPHDSRQLG